MNFSSGPTNSAWPFPTSSQYTSPPIEQVTQAKAAPTAKQHLAAISMLFDWLTTGGVIAFNPAASVRGPKHVVKPGKTPVLTAAEARQLLDSIDTTTLIGLRDRALIGVMVYSFGRIGAALGMKVGDYYVEGRKAWFRLHEKGGKRREELKGISAFALRTKPFSKG
jgi:integrase/recombinase XerD